MPASLQQHLETLNKLMI